MNRTDEKKALRQTMRARRNSLDLQARAAASREICRRLLQLDALGTARRVGVYLATPQEANIDDFIQHQINSGVFVAAPVLDAKHETEMPRFARLRDLKSVEAGGWTGMRSPTMDGERDFVDPASLHAIVLPGLAFDLNGARLGQGGGWYDRVLESASGVLLIGVAFDFQIVPLVPQEKHDRRVHIVVTESRIITRD